MKTRLDQLLLEKKHALTVESARAIIGAGEVLVNEVIADKPGLLVCTDAALRIKDKCPFVSRGGLKLKKGLSYFQVTPAGKVCMDIGASSGGFTDCLLQYDAAKVYAVDVAYGQLAWKIRQDERVVVFERFNARKMTRDDINENIDLAVIDASFISITKLIPPLLPLFGETVSILTLIKPQFELPRNKVEPGGVVRDAELHLDSIRRIEDFVELSDLKSRGVVESPILGPKGNKEFLMLITDR